MGDGGKPAIGNDIDAERGCNPSFLEKYGTLYLLMQPQLSGELRNIGTPLDMSIK